MSMYLCDGCKDLTDTDDYPDNWDSEGQFFCDACIAKHNAEGRALARDYHLTEMAPRGCTCQWVGEGNDPDAHIKRDEWCPLHGRDPDQERERLRDDCDTTAGFEP
jgi:hypothetical protein